MTAAARPSSALPQELADTYLTILAVYSLTGRVTLDDLADMSDTPRSTIYYRLRRLRHAGLIGYEPRTPGSLRPLYRPVQFEAGKIDQNGRV